MPRDHGVCEGKAVIRSRRGARAAAARVGLRPGPAAQT